MADEYALNREVIEFLEARAGSLDPDDRPSIIVAGKEYNPFDVLDEIRKRSELGKRFYPSAVSFYQNANSEIVDSTGALETLMSEVEIILREEMKGKPGVKTVRR